MKAVSLPLLTAFATSLTASHGAPDDPFRKTPRTEPPRAAVADRRTIKLVFESYTMDSQIARDLLVEGEPQATYARTLDLAKEGKAKLDHTGSLLTEDGQSAQAEKVHEYRYAVEWDPAHLIRPDATADAKRPPAKDAIAGPGGFRWVDSPTCTSFETRNIGTNILAEPKVNGNACELKLTLSNVSHRGDREMAPGTGIFQPIFQRSISQFTTAVPLGATTFVATLNAPRESGIPKIDANPAATLWFVTASWETADASTSSGEEWPLGSYVGIAEIYSMPTPLALAISKQPDIAGIAKTRDLVTAGEARLEGVAAVRGPGGRQTLDSTIELRYPTEWDPAQLMPDEAKRWPEIPEIFLRPTPASLETRDLGTRTEMIILADRETRWRMQGQFTATRLTAIREATPGSHIYLPSFDVRTAKWNTECPARIPGANPPSQKGRTVLAATTPSTDDPDRTWLTFVTVHGSTARVQDSADRAAGIIIASLSVREMPVDEALKHLEDLSREADPQKIGVKFRLKDPFAPGTAPKVTISLKNIPVIEALRYFANLTNLEFTEESGDFVLTAKPIIPGLPGESPSRR